MRPLLRMSALVCIAFAAFAMPLSAKAGNFDNAQDTFNRMPLKAKFELQMLLNVSGFWSAISSDQFGHKLFDAIESYEASVGLADTPTISPQLFASLHQTADPLLNLWNMTPIDHRFTRTRLWVPNGFNLKEQDTPTGRDISNEDDTIAVSYNYFASTDLSTIYQRLLAAPDSTINYHLLRSEFFVVSSTKGSRSSYTRYHVLSGGVIGFTFSWDTPDWVHGERIANLMSDLFRSSAQFGLERAAPSRRSREIAIAPPMPPPAAAPNALMAFSDVAPATSAPSVPSMPSADPEAAERDRERAKQAMEDRFNALSGNAKQLIDEAASFVKADPSNSHVLDTVQQIADLNASLNDHDPDVTQRHMLALSAALQKDPGFAKYEAQQAEILKRDNARYLGDALRAAKSYEAFLVTSVTQNPSSPNAAILLPLIKRLEAVIAVPELGRAQAVNTDVDLSLRQLGLHNDFALATAATDTTAQPGSVTGEGSSTPSTPSTGTAAQASAVRLAATDKNRFLMNGDLGDVVLMFNTSPRAPHVVRNLRGDIVFEAARADICVVGEAAGDTLTNHVRSALAPYDLKTLVVAPNGCDSEHLLSYDVVATRRGTFLKQDMQFSLALTKEIEADGFKSLVTLTDAQIQAATAADAVRATEIENDVVKEAKFGFGFLVLQTHSPAVCMLPTEMGEGHRRLLLTAVDKVANELGTAPTLVVTSIDDAFLNIKRSQCGIVYGAAADLKTLVEGLKRDAVSFRFSTLWFTPEDVKSANEAATSEKAAADKQMAKRQRTEAEQSRLATLREADAAATQESRQKALRDANEASAKASSAQIAQDIKTFTDDPTVSTGAAQSKFPDFVSWYRQAMAEKWELMTEDSAVDDYGVSDWKGRNLTTAFTRLTVRLKNPMLGDYKNACLILGQIEDSEFHVVRDPVEGPCDDTQVLTRWRNAHGFQSRWIVQ